MRSFLIIVTCFLTFQKNYAQKNQYFPQAFFNQKEAENQLGKGNSTIEGIAFTREKKNIPLTLGIAKVKMGKKHTAGKNTVVMLFPVTDYFMEFYNLRKKVESKKSQVLMSQEAFNTRREAYTDDYGRFKFSNLKAGKYYLETIIDFTLVGSYKEQVGNSNYYNIYGNYLYSSPIYKTFFYDYEVSHRESKFVEITRDGQVIEIKL